MSAREIEIRVRWWRWHDIVARSVFYARRLVRSRIYSNVRRRYLQWISRYNYAGPSFMKACNFIRTTVKRKHKVNSRQLLSSANQSPQTTTWLGVWRHCETSYCGVYIPHRLCRLVQVLRKNICLQVVLPLFLGHQTHQIARVHWTDRTLCL